MVKQRIIIITVLLIILNINSNAQNNINLKGGLGISELAGISAGLQVENVQLMVGTGMIPIPEDNLFSFHGDIFLHLLGKSDISPIKPWYGRFGLNHFREKTPRWIDNTTYLDLRLGKSFFFSENLSLEFDMGLIFELSYNREEIIPTTSWFNLDFPVLPSIGTRLVYRFPT